MYTEDFEDKILFTPARKEGEACNHLKIVTAFTDVERISSHKLGVLDGTYITKQMLEQYGKTKVLFKRYEDGIYTLEY